MQWLILLCFLVIVSIGVLLQSHKQRVLENIGICKPFFRMSKYVQPFFCGPNFTSSAMWFCMERERYVESSRREYQTLKAGIIRRIQVQSHLKLLMQWTAYSFIVVFLTEQRLDSKWLFTLLQWPLFFCIGLSLWIPLSILF